MSLYQFWTLQSPKVVKYGIIDELLEYVIVNWQESLILYRFKEIDEVIVAKMKIIVHFTKNGPSLID